MIVWGGSGNSYLNSGGLYDPLSNSWIPTSADSLPPARFSHSATWTGQEMLIVGGYSGGASPDPYFYSYTPPHSAVRLEFQSQTNWTNRLQYKANLADQQWTYLSDAIAGTGTTISETNLLPSRINRRFYRLEAEP
jgi:hypothetical protein